MGAVTVLEELPRRSMSFRTIWTTASLTSATLDRASTPIRPGENTATKMPCNTWIRGECKLGDKCRFEHDPEGAPKTGGADEKEKGKAGK